jgi:sulfatase modifying factor 1
MIRAYALVTLSAAVTSCSQVVDVGGPIEAGPRSDSAYGAGVPPRDAAAATDGHSSVDGAGDVLCTPGTAQCSGTSVVACGTNGTWGEPSSCATSQCSSGACAGSTTKAESCASGGVGLTNCGPGKESCCTSPEVAGGTFYRSYDDVTYTSTAYPATVSGFRLDKYEITVGRFRQFVSAVVGGWLPTAGSGKHTYLNGGHGLNATGGGYEAGWDAKDWNGLLATTSAAWNTNLACPLTPPFGTWTPSVAGHENLPINCATWFEAYAFCIWDGGFLPSEAEWNYAAAGGGGSGGQRAFPWSRPSKSADIDCSDANYYGCPASAPRDAPNDVGSESPAGDGSYGQTDLAGNLWEWVLDYYAEYANPCTDCADLTGTPSQACGPSSSCLVLRGGSYDDGVRSDDISTLTAGLLVSFRYYSNTKSARDVNVGARCARSP